MCCGGGGGVCKQTDVSISEFHLTSPIWEKLLDACNLLSFGFEYVNTDLKKNSKTRKANVIKIN